MTLQQLEQLERLCNEYLLTQDDLVKEDWYGTNREVSEINLGLFLDWLRYKLDFESDEVSE